MENTVFGFLLIDRKLSFVLRSMYVARGQLTPKPGYSSANFSFTPWQPASPLKCDTDGGILEKKMKSLAPIFVFLRETSSPYLFWSPFDPPLNKVPPPSISAPPQFRRWRLYHRTTKKSGRGRSRNKCLGGMSSGNRWCH